METARTIKTIRLPNGRSVTLSAYVAGWKFLKDVPPNLEIKGWGDFPCYAAEVLRDFAHGLHDRINLRGGLVVREGRASLASYSMARTPRVRIEPSRGRTFPPAARRALAHRIHAFED